MDALAQRKAELNEELFNQLCQHIVDALECFCPCLNETKDKKKCVEYLQKWLCCRLNGIKIDCNAFCKLIESGKDLPKCEGQWQIEYQKPNNIVNDRVDIYNTINGYHWIIELDAPRADQVAKKAFSRIALFGTGKEPIFYVSIIYPGTNSMNENEVIKYSRYGYDIVKGLNSFNDFRTIIIDCENSKLKIIRFDKMKFRVNGNGAYSMSGAVKKATEIYLKQRAKSYKTLEEALLGYNNNHNGLQAIVSTTPFTKGSITLTDAKGTTFYVTKQWSYNGASANFEEIIEFFKTNKINIEPIFPDQCNSSNHGSGNTQGTLTNGIIKVTWTSPWHSFVNIPITEIKYEYDYSSKVLSVQKKVYNKSLKPTLVGNVALSSSKEKVIKQFLENRANIVRFFNTKSWPGGHECTTTLTIEDVDGRRYSIQQLGDLIFPHPFG